MYVASKRKQTHHIAHESYPGAGAAYGTAKSGIGIAGVGTFRPDLIMKVGHEFSGSYGLNTDISIILVPDPSGHGRYYCRIFTGHIRLDSWRFGATTGIKLQSFQVWNMP